MATRKLEARLTAQDSISKSLQNIADSATDAAEGTFLFADSADEAEDEAEDAEDEVDSLSSSFSGLIDNAIASAKALDLTEEKIESAGDEASQTTAKVAGLAASLKGLDSIDDVDIDIDRTLQEIDDEEGGDISTRKRFALGDGADKIEVEDFLSQIDVEDFLSEIGVEDVPEEIDVEDFPDHIDVEEFSNWIDVEDFPDHIDVDDVPRRIRVVGDDRGGVGRTADITRAIEGLSFSNDLGDYDADSPERSILPGGRESFGSKDIDLDIDWPSERSRDVDTGGFFNRGRRMLGDGGLFDFSRWTGELGGETSEITSNFLKSSEAGEKFTNVLDDISNASVNVGPLNTSLKTTLAILPALIAMLGSLATVTGGFAIGGLGALGGLGAILGGGLWFAGQQRAMVEPMVEGEDGSLRRKTPMEGLQSLLSDYGEQAKQALAPLQNQQFANLSLDVLSGGITLLGDFVTSVSRLSSVLMPLADVIGDSFWQNEPEFIAEMEKLIVAILPFFADFVTYLLGNIPDALAFMRGESKKLLPVLGNFLTSLIDLMGPMFEIGTALWSVLLPPLTILLDLLTGILSPITDYVVPAFEALGLVINWISERFGGVIQSIGRFIGIVLGIAALPAIISALSGALTILSGALTALTFSTPFGWVAIGIGLIIALLDHFGILDDAISGIIDIAGDLESILQNLVGEYVMEFIYSIVPSTKSPEPGTNAYQKAAQGEKSKGIGGEIASNIKFRLGLGGEKYNILSDTQTPGQMFSGSGGNSTGSDGSNAIKTAESNLSGSNNNLGSTQGLGEGGDTYVTVNAGEDTSEPRIKRFVREGVEAADKDQRQRTSGSQ